MTTTRDLTPRERLKVDLSAVLCTLAEQPDGSAPEGVVYTALGMDMERYGLVREVLVHNELATLRGYVLRVTDAGRALAERLNALLTKQA